MDDVAFRFLIADQAPEFRSIARFRRRHLDALADLFLQSLHLAQKLGMVKMGRVALDSTKREANDSDALNYAVRSRCQSPTNQRYRCVPRSTTWHSSRACWTHSPPQARGSRSSSASSNGICR